MGVPVELVNKTTILFPPKLHARLRRIARQRRTSIGQLVRQACEAEYGLAPSEERIAAVGELRRLCLPVGMPADMKREAVPGAGEIPT